MTVMISDGFTSTRLKSVFHPSDSHCAVCASAGVAISAANPKIAFLNMVAVPVAMTPPGNDAGGG
ncbi:MAG: hypothetical protein ACTSYE_11685 [Alphaproteobacteria bacterium]